MSTPTIQHAEEIARKWFPGTNEITVEAVRRSALDVELREVLSRRLLSINVSWGSGDARTTTRLQRAEVEWLRDALTAALDATNPTHTTEAHDAPEAS